MHPFHFAKVISPIGQALSKETILSKAINNIDAFKISLTSGLDDSQRKNIDTIMKLDNGKTMILEIKWPQVRTKNTKPLTFKKWKTITIDFSEYPNDQWTWIYIDYLDMQQLTVGVEIATLDGDTIFTIKENNEGSLTCIIVSDAILQPQSPIVFHQYEVSLPFVTTRDERDMLRAINNGVHTLIANHVQTSEDILMMRSFLSKHQSNHMKIFVRVQNLTCIQHIHDIAKVADGILIHQSDIHSLTSSKTFQKNIDQLIASASHDGKPVIIWLTMAEIQATKNRITMISHYLHVGVSAFLLGDDVLDMDDPTDFIVGFFEDILAQQLIELPNIELGEASIDPEYKTNDYIIYSAYRAIRELDVKAIICFTENGYTASKLSSYRPAIPLIAFTKSDATYRYINLLWAVKWYKVAPGFDYTNIKQIGKEIIRIIFKWWITLDDKIVIVHASSMYPEKNIINGMEIYKFKDI